MSCTCGRSPTGKCVGWHKLTVAEYLLKKTVWEAKQNQKKDAAQTTCSPILNCGRTNYKWQQQKSQV